MPEANNIELLRVDLTLDDIKLPFVVCYEYEPGHQGTREEPSCPDFLQVHHVHLVTIPVELANLLIQRVYEAMDEQAHQQDEFERSLDQRREEDWYEHGRGA